MIVMELRSMDSPRPKKVFTGHFFAPPAVVQASSNPTLR